MPSFPRRRPSLSPRSGNDEDFGTIAPLIAPCEVSETRGGSVRGKGRDE